MSKKMVERYDSFCLEGKGYIYDRLFNLKIVKFNFPRSQEDVSKKLIELCENYLEEL